MDKQKVLPRLISDLQSFLSLLDSENLSYIAQAQKKSISELLSKLQTNDSPVEDAEYMIMSCQSSSPIKELTDSPETEIVGSSDPGSKKDLWQKTGGPTVPPLPPGGLGDDEEDTYEEAEPYLPANTTLSNAEEESDSSHYESYGEEEDDEGEGLIKDRAHYLQWSSSQRCLRPIPESHLCGYLWKRKWLGQWTKQLFIIRNNTLLCYKCARDLLPHLELNLLGCQLVYKLKNNGKIQHQLKLVLLGSETLVLGYSSFQQAEEWRKVIEEVSVGGDVESHRSSSLVRSEQQLSCRSSTVCSDSEEERPPPHYTLPKEKDKDRGFLNVLMNCQWQSLLCRVEAGSLNMFGEAEEKEQQSPQYTIQLRGCEVRAGPDTDRSYRIALSLLGDQVAMLEFSSSEVKQCWLNLLQEAVDGYGLHDGTTQNRTGAALSGLQTRRFPTSNTYMDDPFHLSRPSSDQPIYPNTAVLQNMLQTSQEPGCRSSVSSKDSVTYSNTVFTCHSESGWVGIFRQRGRQKTPPKFHPPAVSSDRKSADLELHIQKLELTGKRPVQLRAGSETNLTSAGKQNKHTSFRRSLAVCTERAQAGFLNPLLRRTASAKNSLRRAPSALFIEHGKVFQRRKEWESKAAA